MPFKMTSNSNHRTKKKKKNKVTETRKTKKVQKNKYLVLPVMPTHPHQAVVTRILTSSPACQNSCLSTRIFTLKAGSKIQQSLLRKIVIKSIDMMTLNFVMVARTLDFVWMSHRVTHKLTDSLPEETLRKKYPYSDFFWSVFSRIQTLLTPCLSVCSPNAGKCGPEKLRIRSIFMQRKSSKVFKYCEIITDKLLIVLLV